MNNLGQNKIKEIIENFQKQISTPIRPLHLFDEQFQRQIELMTEPIRRIQLLSQVITTSLRPLIEFMKNFDYEGWEEFLEEFGWIEAISMSYASELKEKLKQYDKEEVWRQLIDDFKNEDLLNELIGEIKSNNLISKREKILSKAIYHHKHGDYISSIPLLLAQIEGTLWDIGIEKGLIENKPNSTNLIDKKGNLILDKNKNGKPIKCSLGELIIKLFGNTSKFGEHIKTNVYSKDFRHPILHGREINYGDEQRSTMLLLMLFVLLEKTKR